MVTANVTAKRRAGRHLRSVEVRERVFLNVRFSPLREKREPCGTFELRVELADVLFFVFCFFLFLFSLSKKTFLFVSTRWRFGVKHNNDKNTKQSRKPRKLDMITANIRQYHM